ncbi:MAG: hypothetical protein OHK0038_25390 [Flammeovirgaceae bacterium]
MKNIHLYLLINILILLFACKQEVSFVPKPKGYPRVEFPPHEYVKLPEGKYPYQFEISKYAEIHPDTSFVAQLYAKEHKNNWIELRYPLFKNQISVSYYPVRGNLDSLMRYVNTSHKLTNKHMIKATAIDEILTRTPNGDWAILFELEGDVPSQFQYFITDSTTHFIRAALYFPTSTHNDSLAPIIQYVKEDMLHMLNSTTWTKKGK